MLTLSSTEIDHQHMMIASRALIAAAHSIAVMPAAFVACIPSHGQRQRSACRDRPALEALLKALSCQAARVTGRS
jgi:hypothetical protein